jgi:hypothetical protein
MATGVVLFVKANGYGKFGFLIDDAIRFDDRTSNVYWDRRSFAEGVTDIAKGQRVKFEYDLKSEKPRTKFYSIEPIED